MNVTRGLFRLWLVLSALWMASVAVLFLTSEGLPARPRPPGQCVAAKSADECAGLLEKAGKNPFDAYGFVGSEPVYGGLAAGGEESNEFKRFVGLAFGPPGLVFLIGGGFVWAFKGFAKSTVTSGVARRMFYSVSISEHSSPPSPVSRRSPSSRKPLQRGPDLLRLALDLRLISDRPRRA